MTQPPMPPLWLALARADLGLRETPGIKTTPKIARWLIEQRAWWADDETPWCGIALAAWMRAAGHKPPALAMRAKSWATWGQPCSPVRGAVVVLERKGGGHVALLEGRDTAGRWLLLGGNQGDQVSIAAFTQARVIATRWPSDVPLPGWTALPVAAAPVSTGEA